MSDFDGDDKDKESDKRKDSYPKHKALSSEIVSPSKANRQYQIDVEDLKSVDNYND